MKTPSHDDWDALKNKIIGLGEHSLRKSYYPELQEKLTELERFKALLDQAKDIILLLEVPDGRLIDASQSASRELGYTRAQLLSMSILGLVPPETAAGITRFFSDESADNGRQEILTTLLQCADGHALPVEVTLRLVCFNDKPYAVAVARDITERQRTEAELARHRDHLEEMVRERTRDLEAAQKGLIQKEKLKTLGTIAAELAHEIRNPLMVIGGFALRLKHKAPDLPELDIILAEAQRLEKILNRIKNYLKPVEMRPQECSVNSVLLETLDLLASEIERSQATLKLALDEKTSLALVDPGILTQVFVNVITGALAEIMSGTELTIQTRQAEESVLIEFCYTLRSQSVADSEVTFLAIDGGSDTGLPVCFRLITAMGGRISFRREHDRVISTVSLLTALQAASSLKTAEGTPG